VVVPRLPKNPESCPCRVAGEYLELLVQDFEMPLSQMEGQKWQKNFKNASGQKLNWGSWN
jgi:hypothetical protein